MNETEWLTCDNPQPMLRFLTAHRLIPCSRCGQLWEALPDGSWTFLPGQELRPCCDNAEFHGDDELILPGRKISERKLRLFADACREHFYGSATNGGTESRWEHESRIRDDGEKPIRSARLWASECSQKLLRAALLREIVGNPFHLGLTHRTLATHGILDWNGNTIPRLALRMYESRNFSGMGPLHDALVDAECADEWILRHCRGQEPCIDCVVEGGEFYPVGWCPRCDGTEDAENGGWMPLRAPHVRGCWVIDLMLGKE